MHGLDVVRVLEAAEVSAREDGRLIVVEPMGSSAGGKE
jgi:hypothetical protein